MDSKETPTDDTQPVKPIAALARLQNSVRALWVAVILIAMIALLSLAVNVALVFKLMGIRNSVADTLASASRSLDNLAGQGISFDFPVSQTIVFEGDVPVKQDIAFPFKGEFPINTTVSIPVDLGPLLGKQVFNVPVNTAVPVDVTVPVHFEQTVHVKTQVPVKMTVPIRLGPNDPPLRDLVIQLRAWLENLRKSL